MPDKQGDVEAALRDELTRIQTIAHDTAREGDGKDDKIIALRTKAERLQAALAGGKKGNALAENNENRDEKDAEEIVFNVPNGTYDGHELIAVMKEVANPTPKGKRE